MPPRCYLPYLILLVSLASTALSAQEDRELSATHIEGPAFERPHSAVRNIFTVSSEADEVQVRFIATDRAGRSVPQLRVSDVDVLTDENFSPQIKSFGTLRAAPITLGFLVDLSDSIRPEMYTNLASFSDSIGKILQSNRDREFVVAFSSNVELLQPPTADFSQVKRALERGSAHNLTSLYDAIVRTCREQFGALSGSGDETRVIVLFSDGMDNLSIHSLDDAVDAAVNAGVSIYAIAQQFGDLKGRQILEQLAERTGGGLELLRRKESPDRSVAEIQALANDEYTLSFRPLNRRPGFHPIELRATKPSLVLHARKGYYVDQK